jgi:hypothetical protein
VSVAATGHERTATASRLGCALVVALVVVGLGWTLVSAGRGHTAISRLNATARVERAQQAFSLDTCVQAAIRKRVPDGAPVWVVPGGNLYWSYSLGPMSAPDHQVVSRPRPGAYSLRVVPAVPAAGEGVVCTAPSREGDADVMLEVRRL